MVRNEDGSNQEMLPDEQNILKFPNSSTRTQDDLLLCSFSLLENFVKNKDLQMTNLKEFFMPYEEINQKACITAECDYQE